LGDQPLNTSIQKSFKFIQNLFYSEFAKIYERLGVTLIERGESFYQDMMGSVVEDLEKQGTVLTNHCTTLPNEFLPGS
jgi:arginyl-tRNA synthetase